VSNEESANEAIPVNNGNCSDEAFCTGSWTGHWEQAGCTFATTLRLEFRDNGILYGAGQDAAGPFTMGGEYDPNSGVMRIKKLYGSGVRIDLEGTYVRGEPPTISGTWYGKRVAPGPFFLRLEQLRCRDKLDHPKP
jgi:hypothetical protein